MRANIYDINNRRLGYVDFGANDRTFADAAFHAYDNGLPLPSLAALKWEFSVHNTRGNQVGRIVADTQNLGRLDSAEVSDQSSGFGSGVPIGRADWVLIDLVRLFRYSRPGIRSEGNYVGLVKFGSDLRAVVHQDPMFYDFYKKDQDVGSVQLDPDPLLENRFTGGDYALELPQIAIFRPNIYAGGAALLLLLRELGG